MPADRPTRRAVLAGAAALLALAGVRPARALGDRSRFHVAELELGGNTVARPEAWRRLMFEVVQSTSIDARPDVVRIRPDDPALFEHPFAVVVGTGAFPELSGAAAEQLRRYLSYGGFLFLDDASGDPDGPFHASAARLARRLFPTRPLTPLPADHSLYRAFFLLDRPLGRVALRDVLEGVDVGPVTPLVYCPNDLSGALDRAPDGRDRYPVVPGGRWQRLEAVKLGINVVVYSLTSNYKHDTVHVLELMRDGRLR